MKVLFLTNILSPYRVDFFQQLGKYVELTVVYELTHASNRNKNWASNINDVDKSYKEIFLDAFQLITDGGISFRVIKLLNKNYDFIIVGTHGTPTAKIAMLYMRLMGINYILNIDGMVSAEVCQKSWLNRQLRYHLFNGASAYLVSGNETIKYLENLSSKFKGKQYFKYHFSSIVEKDIRIIDGREKKKLKEKLDLKLAKYIICVARFEKVKRLTLLINSMKNMPNDVGLILIGGDPIVYKGVLEQLSHQVRERIVFPGFLVKNELWDYYLASDLFVLPTAHDEWGLVINEALSVGLPVITTKNCGAGVEIISNYENGFIVNVDNLEELQNRMMEILENRTLAKRMKENNYFLARLYTIEQMVKDHLKILRELK